MAVYRLRLDLPGAPSINTASARHWAVRKKEKDHWHSLVRDHLTFFATMPKSPLTKAAVRITRCTAAPRAPDADNLAMTGKFILDELVSSGVLLDDNQDVIGQPEYRWEKAPRNGAHVIVEVEGKS